MWRPDVGSQIAGYRIEALVGRGGMGVVYRASQTDLGRTVALKLIAPEVLDDAAARARFLSEARHASAIEHPNVLPVYAAGETDGVAYLAMRFVEGDDLRTRVRRDGALSPFAAATIVRSVAGALDAIHAAGLVHRDIKPANILLAAGDHVYVADFGLARAALTRAGTATGAGRWAGSLHYAAPEQIRGGRMDARTDVYALGGVLFFMLTGRVPFDRDSDEATLWAHIAEPPPRPSKLSVGLPRGLDDVCAKAMAKRPEERYASAGELGSAAVAATIDEVPTASAANSPRARTPSAPPWRVAALSAAALVAIAAGVILTRGPDRPVAHASAGAAVHAASRLSTPTATPEVGLVPANDDFDAARQVRVGVEYAGSMAGATAELGEPRHAGASAAHSVWFRFRAARDAPMTVDSGGSHTGNRLAAYSGSDIAHLRPIAEAADNSPTGAGAVIRFTATRGRTYRIALDGDARDAYRLWVSDGGVKGKGLKLAVDPGQTVASVRAGGLRAQVRARRAVEVELALRVGRTLERRLGLDSPVLGGVRGRVDYGQQLTATIRLKRTVRRALRARSRVRATLRLTILASPAPHRVLVHPVVLGG